MASQDQPTTAEARPPRAHTPILLVDDQRFVGVALARLLEGEPGLELHCCERGAEAEAAADRIRPALILQDLVMPDIDGLVLVRAFQTRAATARTPIVVLSGNDDAATRARALAAGAADYLVKLPTKDVLLACLDRHLSGATDGGPAAAAAPSHSAVDVVLDPEFLAAYRDEGAADPDETLRELFDIFFRDTERLMSDLRRAATAGFSAAVPRVAHALKGCALATGARALAGVCAEMENGTLGAADGIVRLEVELVRVRTTLARPPGARAIGHCSSEAEPEGSARGGASLA
jgi:DNA-binding response OmpR family regulator